MWVALLMTARFMLPGSKRGQWGALPYASPDGRGGDECDPILAARSRRRRDRQEWGVLAHADVW